MIQFRSIEQILLPLSTLLVSSLHFGYSFTPRCGDCWCIPDEGGETPVCPALPEDGSIRDTFDDPDMAAYYKSFQLQNADEEFLKLQASGGGECYPFTETTDVIDGWEESKLPVCNNLNEGENVGVCAYLYESIDEETECYQRGYTIANFETAEAAEAGGAQIAHVGGCGVCSTAQDFGVRIERYQTLSQDIIKCATSYTFTNNFEKLVDCIGEFGFTTDCGLLWAYFTAANGKLCRGPCFPKAETGKPDYNGPPPKCELGSCLECSKNFTVEFNEISGRTMYESGITEVTPKHCSIFYPVLHDPCINATAGGIPEEESVTSEDPPAGSGGYGIVTTKHSIVMVLLSSSLVMIGHFMW